MVENKWIIVGIDPGKLGFITCLYESGEKKCYALPKIKNEVDLTSLNKIFDEIERWKCSLGIDVQVVMERVHSLFESSKGAAFSFGWINGVLQSMIVAHNLPYMLVDPKKWQSEMWSGVKPATTTKEGKVRIDTKATSILACKRLFPDVDLRRTAACKKMDDNKADSLLIAEYGRRKLNLNSK